jgi:hypothetical protein
MHIDLNLISILFRGSIFCLFIYKMYQIFIKEKLRTYLESGLQAARNEQIEFVEKDTLLQATRKRLEGQLGQQKTSFVTLEKKYAQFVAFEQQVAAAEKAAMDERMRNIIEKRLIQQKNLAQAGALRMAVPEAMKRANEELVPQYGVDRGGSILSRYLKTLA